jgi:hypothetical protein
MIIINHLYSCNFDNHTSIKTESMTTSSEQDVSECKDTAELSEVELLEIELKKRAKDDSIAFASLEVYNGKYYIITESEGVKAYLTLKYSGNKTFIINWDFEVNNVAARCNGKIDGEILMDQTQHGFFVCNHSIIHFNFNGTWNGNEVVEIIFEEPYKCKKISGDCDFSGTYIKQHYR